MTVMAQTAQETTVEFNKKHVQGVCVSFKDYSQDIVKGALTNRLEKDAALKGSNVKGWRAYLSQQFMELGTKNFDIYTNVVTIGKKKDQQVVVYLLVSTGNENFVTSASEKDVIDNAKNFLNNFVAYVRTHDINVKIDNQNELIAKLKKEYESLTADKEKMQNQIKDLEKKIISKEDEISKKDNEIKKAEAALSEMKTNL
ncbi:MAG: hypothetical protein J6Y47_00240 [Bacteroidales bacterium]|nr:hypothetical protein [Bacteroidales bacterium]